MITPQAIITQQNTISIEIDAVKTIGEMYPMWACFGYDATAPDAPIEIHLSGILSDKALLHHYRIDRNRSNSYTVWRHMRHLNK